ELDRLDAAYEVALRAVKALPAEQALWDRAEQIARQMSSAEPLADAYEEVLQACVPRPERASEAPPSESRERPRLDKAAAVELGQRAVAFYEEWYEDSERVVRILERLLAIDPEDIWAFDRLKLIFDAQERWDDMFALYDRAAATADK